jgi:mRNA interferase MazF
MKGRQFEIWLADLNPRFGTEPGKKRPVLIVQTNLLNNIHPSTIICPLTSNVYPDVTILRVNLEDGISNMKNDSAVMIDQIRAIDNRRLIKKIGSLPTHLADQVKENLGIILDI